MAIQMQDNSSPPAPTRNPSLLGWVRDMAALCKPDNVVWCDGSEEERVRLTKHAVEAGVLIPLNPKKRPGCYLHRSNPNDVARTEQCDVVLTGGAQNLADLADQRLHVVTDAPLA